jgi:hypothetical protein
MIQFTTPLDGATGTIDAGVIICSNHTTEQLLRSLAIDAPLHAGLPDPDDELLRYLVDQVPFKIELTYGDPAPDRVKGRIY